MATFRWIHHHADALVLSFGLHLAAAFTITALLTLSH